MLNKWEAKTLKARAEIRDAFHRYTNLQEKLIPSEEELPDTPMTVLTLMSAFRQYKAVYDRCTAELEQIDSMLSTKGDTCDHQK